MRDLITYLQMINGGTEFSEKIYITSDDNEFKDSIDYFCTLREALGFQVDLHDFKHLKVQCPNRQCK